MDCEEAVVKSAMVEAVFKVISVSFLCSSEPLLESRLHRLLRSIPFILEDFGGIDDVLWLRLLFDVDGGTDDDRKFVEDLAFSPFTLR